MKYSELIELYKTGKLSEEEKKKVEYDIERQNAISEYLFENDEMLDLEDNDILDNVEEKMYFLSQSENPLEEHL